MLTKVLAIEWAKYDINVNSISPGRTMTPIIEKLRKEPDTFWKAAGFERIPLGRANKPEDVANTVLFLASSESDNITGQAILIDGGSTALHSAYVWPKE